MRATLAPEGHQQLANGAITWSSHRQKSVSLSTTQWEYVAAAAAAATEASWLRKLRNDIGNQCEEPTVLYVANQGAIHSVKNPEFHKRGEASSPPAGIRLHRRRHSLKPPCGRNRLTGVLHSRAGGNADVYKLRIVSFFYWIFLYCYCYCDSWEYS